MDNLNLWFDKFICGKLLVKPCSQLCFILFDFLEIEDDIHFHTTYESNISAYLYLSKII